MINNLIYKKFESLGYQKRKDDEEEIILVNKKEKECDCYADFIYFYPKNCSYCKTDETHCSFNKLTDEEYELIIALSRDYVISRAIKEGLL